MLRIKYLIDCFLPISPKLKLGSLFSAAAIFLLITSAHVQDNISYNIFKCNNAIDQQTCAGSCRRFGEDTYYFHVNRVNKSTVLITARRNSSELNPRLLDFCSIQSSVSWSCLEVKEHQGAELIKQVSEYEFKPGLGTSSTLTISQSFRSKDFYCYLPTKQ